MCVVYDGIIRTRTAGPFILVRTRTERKPQQPVLDRLSLGIDIGGVSCELDFVCDLCIFYIKRVDKWVGLGGGDGCIWMF